MSETSSKPASVKAEEPVGGGLYIDHRGKSKSFVWRGRVAGRSVRKVLTRPETGMVANVANTTLTEARRFVLDMKADAANGGQRHFAHVLAKPKPGDFTVRQAWALYMAKEGSETRKRTADRKESIYRRFIEPAWGDRPARSVSTTDCRALLSKTLLDFEKVGQLGTPVIKLHSDLNCFFGFCLKRFELGVQANPMFDQRSGKPIPVPVKEKPKEARELNERELVWYFRAADEWANQTLSRQAMNRSADAPATRKRAVEATEFLLRSGCRRDENFEARWGWLSEDGLLIPGRLTKNKYPILLPLSGAMKALVGKRPTDAKDDDRIFGASASWLLRALEGIRPIMTRMAGEAQHDGDFANGDDPAHFSLHNFRDTFLTLMGWPKNEDEMPRFPLEVRDAVLNHRPSGVGAKRYHGEIKDARFLYGPRKAAGAYWSNWLDKLKAKALSV